MGVPDPIAVYAQEWLWAETESPFEYWREREYTADQYAAQLGQADEFADFLEIHALIHGHPIPFIWLSEHGHPPTELRANEALATGETPPIPATLSPRSLRRTFASLLYLRGESPVYVMHQMGHTDPKLALRIYTKVMGEQRPRGLGARLVGVLDGAAWTHAGTNTQPTAEEILASSVR